MEGVPSDQVQPGPAMALSPHERLLQGITLNLGPRSIPNSDIESLGVLGRGSFGTVYKARCKTWGLVAVKKLEEFRLDNPRKVQEFQKEVSMLLSLSHQNVMQLYGLCYGEPGDTTAPGMVTELCERGSLKEAMDRLGFGDDDSNDDGGLLGGGDGAQGRGGQGGKDPGGGGGGGGLLTDDAEELLSWPRRVDLALQVAQGMEYLHANSVLHRDLKSLNILLTSDWKAKLSDFGMATFTDGSMAGSETCGQHPRWAAPEVLLGKVHASRYSDAWAFGMVLLELLTLRIPFDDSGMSFWAIYNHVTTGNKPDVPSVETLPGGPDLPQVERYIQLMRACLATKPKDRPSFGEIRRQLEAVQAELGGTPPAPLLPPAYCTPPPPLLPTGESTQGTISRASAVSLPGTPSATTGGFAHSEAAVEAHRSHRLDVDPLFCGRDRDVEVLLGLLGESDCVNVVGSPGEGKTALAIAVADRMWRQGSIKGGVYFADLTNTNVGTMVQAIALACMAPQERSLALTEEPLGALCDSLRKRVGSLNSSAAGNSSYNGGTTGGPSAVKGAGAGAAASEGAGCCLLVLDNAEDPLAEGSPKEVYRVLRDLLDCGQGVPGGLKLLITSRLQLEPEGVDTRHFKVLKLPAEDAVALLRRLAPGELSSDEEAAEVAAKCDWNPLALRVVAGVLKAGFTSVEDVMSSTLVEMQQGIYGEEHKVRDVIWRTLTRLREEERQALLLLSMFPGEFPTEAAAEVLCALPGASLKRAKFVLRVLEQWFLITPIDRRAGRYQLHMLVRDFAEEERGSIPGLYREAQTRYVSYYMHLLSRAADTYDSPDYHEHLAAAVAQKRNWGVVFKWISDPGLSPEALDALLLGFLGHQHSYRVLALAQADLDALEAQLTRLALGTAPPDATPVRLLQPPPHQQQVALVPATSPAGALGASASGLSLSSVASSSGSPLLPASSALSLSTASASGGGGGLLHRHQQYQVPNGLVASNGGVGGLAAGQATVAVAEQPDSWRDEDGRGLQRRLGVAHILNALAHIRFNKSAWHEASELHDKARELQEQVLGKRHPQCALSRMLSCSVRRGSAVDRQVVVELQEAAGIFDENCRLAGGDPRAADNLVRAKLCLANALKDLSEHGSATPQEKQVALQDAEHTAVDALRLAEEVYGPRSAQVARPLNILGQVYLARGLMADAERVSREALAIVEVLQAGYPAQWVTSSKDLARFLVQQRKYEEAEALLRKVLAYQEDKLGCEASMLAPTLRELAYTLSRSGQHRSAELCFRRALDIKFKAYSEDDPRVASSHNQLAHCLFKQHKYGEAGRHYAEALRIREKALGSAHELTEDVRRNIQKLERRACRGSGRARTSKSGGSSISGMRREGSVLSTSSSVAAELATVSRRDSYLLGGGPAPQSSYGRPPSTCGSIWSVDSTAPDRWTSGTDAAGSSIGWRAEHGASAAASGGGGWSGSLRDPERSYRETLGAPEGQATLAPQRWQRQGGAPPPPTSPAQASSSRHGGSRAGAPWQQRERGRERYDAGGRPAGRASSREWRAGGRGGGRGGGGRGDGTRFGDSARSGGWGGGGRGSAARGGFAPVDAAGSSAFVTKASTAPAAAPLHWSAAAAGAALQSPPSQRSMRGSVAPWQLSGALNGSSGGGGGPGVGMLQPPSMPGLGGSGALGSVMSSMSSPAASFGLLQPGNAASRQQQGSGQGQGQQQQPLGWPLVVPPKGPSYADAARWEPPDATAKASALPSLAARPVMLSSGSSSGSSSGNTAQTPLSADTPVALAATLSATLSAPPPMLRALLDGPPVAPPLAAAAVPLAPTAVAAAVTAASAAPSQAARSVASSCPAGNGSGVGDGKPSTPAATGAAVAPAAPASSSSSASRAPIGVCMAAAPATAAAAAAAANSAAKQQQQQQGLLATGAAGSMAGSSNSGRMSQDRRWADVVVSGSKPGLLRAEAPVFVPGGGGRGS